MKIGSETRITVSGVEVMQGLESVESMSMDKFFSNSDIS